MGDIRTSTDRATGLHIGEASADVMETAFLSTSRQPTAAGPPVRQAGRSVRGAGFGINGRFLTQRVTGVQRYAREVTRALDRILANNNQTADLLVPAHAPPLPDYDALSVRRTGSATGHVWEQVILPGAGMKYPLLNFCNTAPAARHSDVVCIHDANVFVEPTAYGSLFRSYYKLLLPWIAKRAMRVTTVSRYSAIQIATHLGLRTSAIDLIPNGHEHALAWNPARSGLAQTFRVERPYVLLLGSRARHKNTARLTGLAEALAPFGLDIVVVGAPSSIFAAAGVHKATNLRYVENASDDDLAWLLSRALCLAFPSLTEGFGLPVLEAMAWDCPVVSSDRASLPEICDHAALYADPTDDRLWLKHIFDLKTSSGLRSEMRARGRVQAKTFSWSTSARAYWDLVTEPAKEL